MLQPPPLLVISERGVCWGPLALHFFTSCHKLHFASRWLVLDLPVNPPLLVCFQQVLPGQYAFVLHTASPFSGERGEMYGELVCGLGETLVGNHPGRPLAFSDRPDGSDMQVSHKQLRSIKGATSPVKSTVPCVQGVCSCVFNRRRWAAPAAVRVQSINYCNICSNEICREVSASHSPNTTWFGCCHLPSHAPCVLHVPQPLLLHCTFLRFY
jgi:hypothetical protein